MRSESTSALGQPRLTKPTFGLDKGHGFTKDSKATIIALASARTLFAGAYAWLKRTRRWDTGCRLKHRPGRSPPGGPTRHSAHGALVVVQEIFGVNSHIRSVVDKFAAHGFSAIAPALFDHIEHHVELGYDQDGVARGLRAGRTSWASTGPCRRCARRPTRWRRSGRVGVVGYCWGGTVAYLSCVRLGLPAVSYYGGPHRPVPERAPKRALAPALWRAGSIDSSRRSSGSTTMRCRKPRSTSGRPGTASTASSAPTTTRRSPTTRCSARWPSSACTCGEPRSSWTRGWPPIRSSSPTARCRSFA